MTPADAIASLDRQLAEHGRTVTIRRGSGADKIEATVKAIVRDVQTKELVGGIHTVWSLVIVSPTGLSALGALKKGDKVVIDGPEREIQQPKPVHVGNQLVRYNLMVAG